MAMDSGTFLTTMNVKRIIKAKDSHCVVMLKAENKPKFN